MQDLRKLVKSHDRANHLITHYSISKFIKKENIIIKIKKGKRERRKVGEEIGGFF